MMSKLKIAKELTDKILRLVDTLRGKRHCAVCGRRLWTGELCEYCFLEQMGRGLREQLVKMEQGRVKDGA